MAPRLIVQSRTTALYAGLGLTLAGILMLHQAYEARGQRRPWAFKLLGLAQP